MAGKKNSHPCSSSVPNTGYLIKEVGSSLGAASPTSCGPVFLSPSEDPTVIHHSWEEARDGTGLQGPGHDVGSSASSFSRFIGKIDWWTGVRRIFYVLMYSVRVSPMGGIFCSTRSISSNLDLKSCSSALSWHCSMECWCCHWQFKPMRHLVAHCGVMRTQSLRTTLICS